MDTKEQDTSSQPYLSKRERKRLRREERRKVGEEEMLKRRMQRALKIAFALGVIIVFGFAIRIAFKLTGPKNPDRSVSYPIQSRDHIAKNAPHPAYNSNPPTGGWHYAETTEYGAHAKEVADEYIVHNLEHGDVWIAYHPRIGQKASNVLKEEFGDEARIVITPRLSNETDIALVAWGHLDTFNINDDRYLDVTRIKDFVKRYRNKGPEKVPAGAHLEPENEEENHGDDE